MKWQGTNNNSSITYSILYMCVKRFLLVSLSIQVCGLIWKSPTRAPSSWLWRPRWTSPVWARRARASASTARSGEPFYFHRHTTVTGFFLWFCLSLCESNRSKAVREKPIDWGRRVTVRSRNGCHISFSTIPSLCYETISPDALSMWNWPTHSEFNRSLKQLYAWRVIHFLPSGRPRFVPEVCSFCGNLSQICMTVGR